MKYNIENNIDFYQELYNSLNDDKTPILSNEETQLCLITNLPLNDNFVELKCGHKFNYEPLYKDVLNHKKKFNNMEPIKSKLKFNQIRCPYCRNVQDELLPYYDELSYPKEHGVNFYDASKNNTFYYGCVSSNNQCQYEISNTDASGNITLQQCSHYGYTHYILKSKYNNTNKYCYSHKVIVINETREKIKQAKLKEKMDLKMKKMEEKNKLKEEKNKLKDELKLLKLQEKKSNTKTKINAKNKFLNIDFMNDVTSENIILTNNNIIHDSNDVNTCIQVLKSGKHAGLPCAMKIYKNCLCKRHFNLENNAKINNNIIP